MFNESKMLISVSTMLEYWYCPRFIYFMECLKIGQNEEKRFKVKIGREIHKKKNIAPGYLRKKLNAVKQEKEIYLSDEGLGICGILDELIFSNDKQAYIIDYKFAYSKRKFKTHHRQLVFYALLAEKNYPVKIERSFIVFTRSGSKLEEFPITDKDRKNVTHDIEEVRSIIEKGVFPESGKNLSKCADCTYRKICI
ncbi:MAG: CRISPR-associated protein Cas4 [Spirochaetes bacterium GWB1_36_13]|nr:MAG: CRISPR-associated protein Cas4 [Spirochaetes bacterium GWB1_36_13]